MLTPQKIAKESEASQQKALFAYCAFAINHGFACADEWCDTGKVNKTLSKPLPSLAWIHSSGNGGVFGDSAKSRKIRGASMKAEGLKPGIPDVFLPSPAKAFCLTWHGLYIEMKKPSIKPKTERGNGGVSYEQRAFGDYCGQVGYAFAVCYSWQEAVAIIKQYLGHEQC